MKFVTNKYQESYWKAKICYICGEKFEDKYANDKKYHKVIDHFHYTDKYRGAAYSICNLKWSIYVEITATSHNGSNYDYYFIIKKLAE